MLIDISKWRAILLRNYCVVSFSINWSTGYCHKGTNINGAFPVWVLGGHRVPEHPHDRVLSRLHLKYRLVSETVGAQSGSRTLVFSCVRPTVSQLTFIRRAVRGVVGDDSQGRPVDGELRRFLHSLLHICILGLPDDLRTAANGRPVGVLTRSEAALVMIPLVRHVSRFRRVEFQNKFYSGNGYKFIPFSFESLNELKIEEWPCFYLALLFCPVSF